ncbi:Regulatory protein BlaR1 [Gimesia panareensis]|uniref:Regulatory protein BlaR1 n=1 Tax=Gimesia panareensis TaxID=2527978 RepID=A0A518FVT1_9PLAN|nr:M56 family metallopeptidase [Gimesia panareensis]QDV20448.1 Regulatory protein BlaR1 [Gimesia panareensis]
MEHAELLRDILIRISLLLALGWLILFALSARNPRWSVLLTRCLALGCLLFPLICVTLPQIRLEVLAPEEEQSKSIVSEPAITILAETEPLPTPNRATDLEFSSQMTAAAEPLKPAQGEVELETESDKAPFRASPLTEIDPIDQTPVVTRVEATPVSLTEESVTTSPTISLLSVIWIVWSAGVAVLLFRLIWQLKRASGLWINSQTVSETVQQQCQFLAERLQLKQRPQVRFSAEIEGPCTAGIIYPVIYLPGDWYSTLQETEQRAILIHELAHVAGRDVLWDLLARLSAMVWWFHPLTWRLPARHRLACEHLSDAQAAGLINSLSNYRRLLAQWTLRRQGAESRLATLAMADRSQMLRRLKWLERPHRTHILGRVPRSLFVGSLICLLSGAGTVVLLPRAAQSEVETNPEESQPVSSQTEDQNNQRGKSTENKADLDFSNMVPHTIRIVNDKQQPVSAANVRIVWWEDKIGRRESVTALDPLVSNQKGSVKIEVPTGATRVRLSVEAKGFDSLQKAYSLNDPLVITLKPGRIIHVKAIDAEGKPLSDAYALLEGSHLFGREIRRVSGHPGYYQSPVVSPDRRWMRVVDGSHPGPILFSPLIDVTHPEEVEADGTIVARLKPGIRLEGRLDDSVPRPIKHGCVELYINEGAAHQIGGGWVWQDTTLVREDGTFVFESLPAGGYAQLYALLDGYQSSQPTDEEFRAMFPPKIMSDPKLVEEALEQHDTFRPRAFPLPLDQSELKVNLPCSRTSAFDLTVLDPAGRPLTNAHAKCAPLGLFVGGSRFAPGNELLSRSQLVRQKSVKEIRLLQDWINASFINVPTDQAGIAHIRNLPSRGEQKYVVRAPGYFMPPYPSLSTPFPGHYAVIDLEPGKTLQRTVTMVRNQRLAFRDLMIMDQFGNPVPNAQVTVSEITFRNSPDNWQVWSTQRFGPVVSETSNKEGKVTSRLPTLINYQGVSRLRITIQLQRRQSGQPVNFRANLVIPRLADDRAAVLTVPDQLLADQPLPQEIKAAYLHPDDVVSPSAEKLLKQFQKNPSLFIFNRLLRLSRFNAVTPLEVCYQMPWSEFEKQYKREQVDLFIPPMGMDWEEYLNRKKHEEFHLRSGTGSANNQGPSRRMETPRPAIYRVSTDTGDRVVVLCNVRPRKADQPPNASFREPPVAAFVFDPANGSLVRMIGGWASSSGDYNQLKLINLGGTRDYFIVTTAQEPHAPFDLIQHWYQLGHEEKPALTIQNYANATRWDGTQYPSHPEAEFGWLKFHFEGQQLDFYQCGQLPNGAMAPRKLFWDTARNQFIGPPEQSVKGKPLYRVDLQNSHQFFPLDVEPGELIVAGGRHFYHNSHQWECVVPQGKTARLRLFSVDGSKAEPIETNILIRDLSAGTHNLRFQFRSNHWEDRTDMEVSIDEQKKKEFTVPRVSFKNVPSVAGTSIVRTGKGTLDLFNRETVQNQKRLIWRVELKP